MGPFILGGGFVFIFGIVILVKHFLKQREEYVIVSGIVVELKEIRYSHGGKRHIQPYYTPVFEYYYDAKTYRVEHNVGLNKNGKPTSLYEIGQAVEIRVYVNSPSEGVLNSPFSVNSFLYGGLLCIGVGAIFTFVGLLLQKTV